MLSGCNSNVTGRDIAQILGEKEVKYGVVGTNDVDKTTKMAFGDATLVTTPKSGMLFDV